MSKNTIYSQACNKVAGFESMGEEFVRKLVIDDKAKSTHENYLRQIAKMALYFGRSPLDLSQSDLEEYLFHLIKKDSDSRSSFKHLVYGLRKLYLLFDREDLQLSLPTMHRADKLPVVLSLQEMRLLLKAPNNLWVRIMLGLIYDTGLRIQELINLRIGDADLNRRQVHVRQSKNDKDRYVPMSSHIVRGLEKHLALNSPKDYLFEHPMRKGIPISPSRIRKLLAEAVDQAGIKKEICVHSLRHTYATHQLESGQNIMTVKDLLGHSCVTTTFLYLHIAQLDTVKPIGCMEILYPQKNA